MRSRYATWVLRTFVVLAISYILLFSAVALAMLQPPERFGVFMRHAPEAVVWGALPAPRMWLWARRGRVNEGDRAPDFTLSTLDHKQRVMLSAYAGRRPVVLVFGSYT
jgi:hypothetical protein